VKMYEEASNGLKIASLFFIDGILPDGQKPFWAQRKLFWRLQAALNQVNSALGFIHKLMVELDQKYAKMMYEPLELQISTSSITQQEGEATRRIAVQPKTAGWYNDLKEKFATLIKKPGTLKTADYGDPSQVKHLIHRGHTLMDRLDIFREELNTAYHECNLRKSPGRWVTWHMHLQDTWNGGLYPEIESLMVTSLMNELQYLVKARIEVGKGAYALLGGFLGPEPKGGAPYQDEMRRRLP